MSGYPDSMSATPAPQRAALDLPRVIQEQSVQIGSLTTQVIMVQVELETVTKENAELRERLAGYENDQPEADGAGN